LVSFRRMEKLTSREFIFFNKYVEYSPPGWVEVDSKWYPLGFKVVDSKNRSLGLRNNQNIITFFPNAWNDLPKNQTEAGPNDWGGVWSALSLSGATTLRKHCLNTWGMKTKIYYAALSNPLYANSYRVKSQGLMLLEELR